MQILIPLQLRLSTEWPSEHSAPVAANSQKDLNERKLFIFSVLKWLYSGPLEMSSRHYISSFAMLHISSGSVECFRYLLTPLSSARFSFTVFDGLFEHFHSVMMLAVLAAALALTLSPVSN